MFFLTENPDAQVNGCSLCLYQAVSNSAMDVWWSAHSSAAICGMISIIVMGFWSFFVLFLKISVPARYVVVGSRVWESFSAPLCLDKCLFCISSDVLPVFETPRLHFPCMYICLCVSRSEPVETEQHIGCVCIFVRFLEDFFRRILGMSV